MLSFLHTMLSQVWLFSSTRSSASFLFPFFHSFNYLSIINYIIFLSIFNIINSLFSTATYYSVYYFFWIERTTLGLLDFIHFVFNKLVRIRVLVKCMWDPLTQPTEHVVWAVLHIISYISVTWSRELSRVLDRLRTLLSLVLYTIL